MNTQLGILEFLPPKTSNIRSWDEMADSPNLHGREVTSDYEPSVDGGSIFGSVTSSVQDHVWEFGRSVAQRGRRLMGPRG